MHSFIDGVVGQAKRHKSCMACKLITSIKFGYLNISVISHHERTQTISKRRNGKLQKYYRGTTYRARDAQEFLPRN